MAAIPDVVVDSVKKLSLNGSAEQTNGALKVRNICCVGAGYVGMLSNPGVHNPR